VGRRGADEKKWDGCTGGCADILASQPGGRDHLHMHTPQMAGKGRQTGPSQADLQEPGYSNGPTFAPTLNNTRRYSDSHDEGWRAVVGCWPVAGFSLLVAVAADNLRAAQGLGKCRSSWKYLSSEDLGGGILQVTDLTIRRLVECCDAEDDDVRNNVVGVGIWLGWTVDVKPEVPPQAGRARAHF
jgi:hypothetical protein